MKSSSIMTVFWDNIGYSEAKLTHDFGNGFYLNWIFVGVYL